MSIQKYVILSTGLLLANPVLARVQASAQEDWIPLDRIAVIVNDEAVKDSDLLREEKFQRRVREISISTQAELDQFEQDVLASVVQRRLQTQAGKEIITVPEEDLERLLADRAARDRRQIGTRTYIDDLDRLGMDEDELQQNSKEQHYRQAWRDDLYGITSRTDRPRRDRYVRPGTLLNDYRVDRQQFGAPALVELEQFTLAPRQDAGIVEALSEINSFRQRALKGEEFASFVKEVGRDRSDISVGPIETQNISDDILQEFVAKARPGDISEAISRQIPDVELPIFILCRLIKRIAPVPPLPFVDRQVQRSLTDQRFRFIDQVHKQKAEQELRRSAYVAESFSAQKLAVSATGQP